MEEKKLVKRFGQIAAFGKINISAIGSGVTLIFVSPEFLLNKRRGGHDQQRDNLIK